MLINFILCSSLVVVYVLGFGLDLRVVCSLMFNDVYALIVCFICMLEA